MLAKVLRWLEGPSHGCTDCMQLLALTARVGELSLAFKDQGDTLKEVHHMLSVILDPDFTPARGTIRPKDLEG